ncbi:MAG: hypothetical protein JW900_13105 [Anaerolineae bacterium]|nr:hypothetical protein [Anaerolineae bacterium]
MQRSRLLFALLAAGLLLTALVVGFALAQGPTTGSEPAAPIQPAATSARQDSSRPAAADGSAVLTEEAIVLSGAQHDSSAPISPDGVVPAPAGPPPPEDLPQGINALTNLRLPGTALKPRGDDVSYVPTAGGGCFYASAGNSFRVFNIGVFLPQGSRVDVVRMYYDDTSTSASRAWFSVYDLYGQMVQEWSVDSVGNTGNGFNDTALISHTIDYSQYSYALNWRPYALGSQMQNCGFRIFYQPPPYGGAYLPAVWRSSSP